MDETLKYWLEALGLLAAIIVPFITLTRIYLKPNTDTINAQGASLKALSDSLRCLQTNVHDAILESRRERGEIRKENAVCLHKLDVLAQQCSKIEGRLR